MKTTTRSWKCRGYVCHSFLRPATMAARLSTTIVYDMVGGQVDPVCALSISMWEWSFIPCMYPLTLGRGKPIDPSHELVGLFAPMAGSENVVPSMVERCQHELVRTLKLVWGSRGHEFHLSVVTCTSPRS